MSDETQKTLDYLNAIDSMKTYKADGWQYRDFNWITELVYNEFVEIVGKENIVMLAGSSRIDQNGEKIVRGQFLVSPEGVKRAIEFASRHDTPT